MEDDFLKKLTKQLEEKAKQDHNKVWSFSYEENPAMFYTSMDFWWNKVKDIVKTPKTIQIKVPEKCNLTLLCDNIIPIDYDKFIKDLELAAEKIGYPCFFRSNYTSAKHFWKDTCYLTSKKQIENHLKEIVNFSCVIEAPVDIFYVRELIPTNPLFTAFGYNFPVTREFRFRINNNIIDHVQPYWDFSAIKEPSIENWYDILYKNSMLTPDEARYLNNEINKIKKVLPEGTNWSIDWLQSNTGEWYMTDMAIAEKSYWWMPDFNPIQTKE